MRHESNGLRVHPPGRDYHVVANVSIDIVVEAEAGYALVIGVEGLFRIFAENRAEGIVWGSITRSRPRRLAGLEIIAG